MYAFNFHQNFSFFVVESWHQSSFSKTVAILLRTLENYEINKKYYYFLYNSLNKVVHRDAFCHFTFRWIHYYESIKSTGLETSKSHLCVVISTLAYRSEIAGSNPVFVKLCSLFNFHKISQKEVKKCLTWQRYGFEPHWRQTDNAPTYLQPHYGNGVFGNVYLLTLDNTKFLKLIISLFHYFWCQNWDQWHKMSGKNTYINFFYFWYKNKRVWAEKIGKNKKIPKT